MKITKNYRLSISTIEQIEIMAEKCNITKTELIEQAIYKLAVEFLTEDERLKTYEKEIMN